MNKRAWSVVIHGAVALALCGLAYRYGSPWWMLPPAAAGLGAVWELCIQWWRWGDPPDRLEWFGFVAGGIVASMLAVAF